MSLPSLSKNTAHHNRVLIVSVEKFSACAGLDKRSGARLDTKRLHAALSRRGFLVKILMDPDAHEIIEAFKAESQQSVPSCFMGVISSHGEKGVIFGSDGRPVKLAHIYAQFGGSTMAGKNKLFLIQACRGIELDDGVEVETDGVDSSHDDDVYECQSIPNETVVAYATAPGYSAFMHPSGSVFMKTFCDLLEECDGWEITRFLTRLNGRVAFEFEARGDELKGKKEMPCFVSRLTADCYPFINALRVSATELLRDTHTTRKSSIS
ncbi:caspase-3-like [Clarias gariepinus]|uniref:caspase-3-like n=1 Tax=Clarias gariepinus TaxID=13013 RepID=UPI00234E3345|nr:caspase-3-like [Clarias gariepinus]